MTTPDEVIAAGAERLDDLLTMLGVNPDERPEHGGDSIAETLARAVLAPVLAARPPEADIENSIRAAYLDHARTTGADPAKAGTFARLVVRRLRASRPGQPLLEMDFVAEARNPVTGELGAGAEDSGQSMAAEFSPGDSSGEGIFLRVMSWRDRGQDAGDPPPEHPGMDQLTGRRLRVQLLITEAPG